LEEEGEQLFNGLEKIAVNLTPFLSSFGRRAPNLAVIPVKISPPAPLTQFLTLTYNILGQKTSSITKIVICIYQI